jgi:hypothetical protein
VQGLTEAMFPRGWRHNGGGIKNVRNSTKVCKPLRLMHSIEHGVASRMDDEKLTGIIARLEAEFKATSRHQTDSLGSPATLQQL